MINRNFIKKTIWLAPVCLLLVCSCDSKRHIRGEFDFINYSHEGGSNIWFGGDMPVVEAGIDSAFWDSRLIVAKGDSVRYLYQDFDAKKLIGDSLVYFKKDKPKCSEFYFVIDMDLYQQNPAEQELSPGFAGPLSKEQLEQLHPGILKGKEFIGLKD